MITYYTRQMKTILSKLINFFKKSSPNELAPENWVDLYCDDFYEKAYVLVEDHKTALDIVELTLLNGIM